MITEELPDETLAALAADGDTDAFAVLVRRYEKTVFYAVYPMTGSRQEAEDVTQEVFLRVWRGLPTFRREAKFSTWLLSTARNVCIDCLRKRKHEKELFASPAEDTEAEAEPADESTNADPACALLRKERTELVRAALAKLPEDYRLVLSLRELQGMSCAEIAALLDIREGTVRTRLHRAKKILKKILENGNFFEKDTSNKI